MSEKLRTAYGSVVSRGETRIRTDRDALTDALLAVALSGASEELGHAIWRLVAGQDATGYSDLMGAFVGRSYRRAKRKNWRQNEVDQIPSMCRKVLRHWATGICWECKGRKFQPVPGAPHVLSDVPCNKCKGSGRFVPGSTRSREAELHQMLDVALDEASNLAREKMRDE